MAEPNYPSDTQFAGLVEAATAAADQEVDWSHNDGAAVPAHRTFEGDQSNTYTALQSGQYDPSLRNFRNGDVSEGVTRSNTRKRKRGTDSIGPDGHIVEDHASGQPGLGQSSLNRTPAVVHSAAALFRAPSNSGKKYTRPPMSKLFSSLQLQPEEFLHLQSAAKAYMLDDDHPERRDCVGQRGKSDSDMVKLKLWHCVQEFLDKNGNGERFFGADASKSDAGDGARTMTWPDDAQQIIKTCVPLLRRMVTNERQRRYAVESRKGGGETKPEGYGKDGDRQKTPPARATITESDNPTTFTSEKIDIFGDGLVSDPVEASEWFNAYNVDGALDRIFIKSGFPRVLFLPLITNIDGHCRFYHGDSGPQCTDTCKNRLVGRLLELPIYQQSAPARDAFETVRGVFNLILTHLIRIRHWRSSVSEDAATSAPTTMTPAQNASNANRSTHRKKTTTGGTAGGGQSKGRSSENPLQLLIYLVHQDKCLVPFFEIPSSKCPNIEALKTQVVKHHGLATLKEKGVASLSEAKLKVWLSDGLVRVEDDGEWMVALLSADSVEWMGGQIRVLLDV
jgi:hypothetical protein